MNQLNPPKTPHHKTRTRDQRLQVHTLRDADHSYADIASRLSITMNQVQYAWNHRLTPQFKLSGVKGILDAESLDVLIDFVCDKPEK